MNYSLDREDRVAGGIVVQNRGTWKGVINGAMKMIIPILLDHLIARN